MLLCMCEREKSLILGPHRSIVVRRRTHVERETDWPKPKISTSSHVGISIIYVPQTERMCILFCGPPAGIQIYFPRSSTAAAEIDLWRARWAQIIITRGETRAEMLSQASFAAHFYVCTRILCCWRRIFMPSGHTKHNTCTAAGVVLWQRAPAIKCV